MLRAGLFAVLLVLTGCGGVSHPTVVTTTSAPPSKAQPHAKPNPNAADLGYARKLLALDAEDALAAQLGGRKAAAPALHAFALRVLRDRNAEIAALHRFTHTARPVTGWTQTYNSLLENAGVYFDEAYVPFVRERIAAERALRAGPLTKALARTVARNRAAESRALARL